MRWARQHDVEHPAVPRVVGVDTQTGVVHVQGPDGVALRHLLAHREAGELRVDTATLHDLAHRLFEPLEVAHRAGRRHGRLSPDTVWLDRTGAISVWGWSEPVGTDVTWAAPEVHAGHAPTSASDVWSAAALLLAIGAGERIRGRAVDVSTAQDLVPDLLGDDPLANVLLRALSSAPAGRPTADAVLRVAARGDASRLPHLGRLLAAGYAQRRPKRRRARTRDDTKPARRVDTVPEPVAEVAEAAVVPMWVPRTPTWEEPPSARPWWLPLFAAMLTGVGIGMVVAAFLLRG
jgi:hypothetical protein